MGWFARMCTNPDELADALHGLTARSAFELLQSWEATIGWAGLPGRDTHCVRVMDFEFEGPVIEWRGPAPFYFVRIPEEESEDIKFAAKGLEYWGQVPVVVRISDIEFGTALFPKDGRYLIPLKDVVRKGRRHRGGPGARRRLDVGRR